MCWRVGCEGVFKEVEPRQSGVPWGGFAWTGGQCVGWESSECFHEGLCL